MLFFIGGYMRVNLYISTRLVKSVKIKQFNNWDEIIKRDYKVRIINQKDIFNKRIVTTWLRPVTLLADPTEKEINLNCIIYGGANIE